MSNINDHGTSLEEEGSTARLWGAFDGKETLFDGGFPLKERVFDLVLNELQRGGLKSADQIRSESFETDQVLLIGKSFDDIGMVVCQDPCDIASCERGSDRVTGLFE